MTVLEENIKKALRMEEMTRLKKGECRCGGDIVMIWGTVLVVPQQENPIPHGPLPEKEKRTKGIGPVCEKCGQLYSPFFFK